MSCGTAYAVAQNLQDFNRIEQLKKEKWEGTKKSLLDNKVNTYPKTAEQELVETLQTPINRTPLYCIIL